jgi:AraC-like DNA-binding protein
MSCESRTVRASSAACSQSRCGNRSCGRCASSPRSLSLQPTTLATSSLCALSRWLLTTECGPKIRQIATGGSHIHQISRVIDWIKGNLSERLRVEDLAGRAGMSVSTLHHHFRSLTALSPLQFEKHLRLNEARRLMLIDRVDAAIAAFQVGCESPSQFSREYSGGTRSSGGRGVEKRNGRKLPRVHGQRALHQGVIFRCFLPATQALEN